MKSHISILWYGEILIWCFSEVVCAAFLSDPSSQLQSAFSGQTERHYPWASALKHRQTPSDSCSRTSSSDSCRCVWASSSHLCLASSTAELLKRSIAAFSILPRTLLFHLDHSHSFSIKRTLHFFGNRLILLIDKELSFTVFESIQPI